MSLMADAYRVGGSILGAAVFDRAGGVGPLTGAKVAGTRRFTDYAQQMLVCLRGCRTGRWWPMAATPSAILRHCQNMSKPIVVVTKLRKDAWVYQPAPPRRPGQIGRPRVVGARCPVPRRGSGRLPLPNGFPTAPPTAVPPWSSSLRA